MNTISEYSRLVYLWITIPKSSANENLFYWIDIYYRLLPMTHRPPIKAIYFIRLFGVILFFAQIVFSFSFKKKTIGLESLFFLYSIMGSITCNKSGSIKPKSRKTWWSSPRSRKMLVMNWSVPLSKICKQAILK